jgi:ribonuclease R
MPGADGGGRVGVVARRGRFTVVEPLFEPGRRLTVDVRRRRDVAPGDLVLVRLAGRNGRAQVVRSLGRPNVARDVVEALLVDRGYERGFPRVVESEAREAARSEDGESRRDLTELPTFTIDPASARDFDDAVSAETDGDGVRLFVHIADVGAFVAPGSTTDVGARDRGNSVYVPGTVEPMLPAALSSDACSLVPGAPRRTVTVEMRISPAGATRSAAFYRSTIRSDERFTYEQVDRFFAGVGRMPDAVAAPLTRARAVAAELRRLRLSRGALGVETSEPEFDFDEEGNVVAARDVVQTEAHGLIEELMILANEQVALKLQNARQPTIYRIHEQPDPDSIEFLVAQLESLDIPTPPMPKRLGPGQAGELAGAISVKLLEYLHASGRRSPALASLVLRALKQAVYSPRNIGHAGLASPAYCHFTSPIRRYPDLCVHRALLATVGGTRQAPAAHELDEIAVHCSATEREAMELERDADDVCLAFLLARDLDANGWDRRFEGEVNGVIGAGAFVSFGSPGSGPTFEGFLPARKLHGDYYDVNEVRTALIGRRTGRRLRLGDPVTVRVRSVETARGRVDLEPAAGAAPTA